MNKELIQQRFSKNLTTYRDNAKIQRKMAQKLLNLLEKKEFTKILEIGCGTGLLTELINKELVFKNFITNDIVEDCETYIKKINPEITFIAQDAENFVTETDEKFDLIISNATFQWIEDLEEFIKSLVARLNPNGVLLFSTFGTENFKEIYQVLGKSLPYFSKPEIENMIKEWNYFTDEEIHVLGFKTPKEVLKHLKNTGVNSLELTIWTKNDIKTFEEKYNQLGSCFPTLTYHPIYVKINN